MPLNMVSPRSDIVFMQRRLRKGEVQVAPVSTKTGRMSLRLGSPDVEVVKVDHVHRLVKDVVLTVDAPVVRLNRRQSAVGSLVVEGAQMFAWDAEGRTGCETLTAPDDSIPKFGNRKLFEFHKNLFIFNLKYFKSLRRVVVWSNDGVVKLHVNDGFVVTLDSSQGKNVFYISCVGDEVEVRLETVVNDDVVSTFGLK